MKELIVKELKSPICADGSGICYVVGEIVRCKDCKHWDGKTLCDAPGSYVPRYAEDFCSQAERREDDKSKRRLGD